MKIQRKSNEGEKTYRKNIKEATNREISTIKPTLLEFSWKCHKQIITLS